MDAMEAILTTRAMRRYSDAPVPDELLMRCLEAAQQAPSGGNVQPQQYVVVRSHEVRHALADIYRQRLSATRNVCRSRSSALSRID